MQKLKTVGQNSGVLYTFVGLEDLEKKSWKCSRCPQWWCQSRWGQQLQEDVCKVLCNTTTKIYHITAEHDKRYIKTHHSLASHQSGWSSTAQCPWKKDNYHTIKQIRKTVIYTAFKQESENMKHIHLKILMSSFLTKLIATPLRPNLPDRPILGTKR